MASDAGDGQGGGGGPTGSAPAAHGISRDDWVALLVLLGLNGLCFWWDWKIAAAVWGLILLCALGPAEPWVLAALAVLPAALLRLLRLALREVWRRMGRDPDRWRAADPEGHAWTAS